MQSIGIRHAAAAAVFVALMTNWSSTLAAQGSPSLTFSTYLGGPGEDRAGGVAVDAQGNIYVAGMTNLDVFVMKLSPAGDQVIYKTILGGSGYEEPSGIAVDGAGNAYVVGTTNSWDFPTVNAMQPSRNGGSDAFIVKLDPAGTILYSTCFGGRADETASGLAVDALGRVYVTGQTYSPDFPTVNAFQPALRGNAAFRTLDDGATWTGMNLATLGVTTFAIDPNDTSTIYAGTYYDGVFKTTDGGATWTPTSADLPALAVHALAIDAYGTLYAGNDASIYISNDGGASWFDGRIWDRVTSIAVDAADNAVYAGASGYYNPGVFKSVDFGGSWANTGLSAGANSVTVSQSIVYAGTDSGVAKSSAGSGWQMLGGIYEQVLSIAANPADPNAVYAGTYNGLLNTADGGADWSPVLGLFGIPIVQIVMAPSSPSTMYVTTYVGSAMTADGGATWRLTGPREFNFGFTIDPLVPTTVYAASWIGSDVFVARLSADGQSLEYSTYLGGSDYEWGSDIAIDATGAAYVVGNTQSTDFPVRHPFQSSAGGLMDVFVAKLTDTGSLAYATYLGGYASDYNPRVAVDASGQAHVTGLTLSSNFPVANAYQPSHGGGYLDAFVTTMNAAGNGLVFSTYLGGSGMENDGTQNRPVAVAIGPSGETVVAGATQSTDFPTRDAVQSGFAGGDSDAFVATFDTAGQLQVATYLGGSGGDHGDRIAVDATGAVIVAGATMSTDFPLRHALQSANAGDADIFIARIGEARADLVPPTIAIAAPQTVDYLHTDAIQISFSASDNDSGVAAGSPSATLDGAPIANGQTLQPLALSLGSHTLVVSASDNAGNRASQPVAFQVKASIDSLIAAVNLFTRQGQIAASASRSLLTLLSDAKSALARGSVTAARGDLVNFENLVKAQSGKAVAKPAAQVLIADVEYVLAGLR